MFHGLILLATLICPDKFHTNTYFTGTCKVRNEIETKRNQPKRNEINENETKRNQRNENEMKRNQRNQLKQNEID